VLPDDDLDAIADFAWSELTRAAAVSDSQFRHAQLATIGAQGWPQSRTVFLRHADASRREIGFHTDRRSAKAAELAANTSLAIVAYDRARGLQLRLWGPAEIHVGDTGGPTRRGAHFTLPCAHRTAHRTLQACYSTAPPTQIQPRQPVVRQTPRPVLRISPLSPFASCAWNGCNCARPVIAAPALSGTRDGTATGWRLRGCDCRIVVQPALQKPLQSGASPRGRRRR
jgi:hypothetical protein